MQKKIYWKDLRQSLLSSKGRFFSICSMMMLGSLALTGLKVTAPNMERTAQAYIQKSKMMDIAVLSSLGISHDDLKELESIEGARVEAGYFKDVELDTEQESLRLFSETRSISLFTPIEGRLPSSDHEIALLSSLKNRYALGDTIVVTEPTKDNRILTEKRFTLVGFVQSAEIWDTVSLGQSTSGSGQLSAFGVVEESVFDTDVYTIARLHYKDLKSMPYHSSAYLNRLSQHQKKVEELLADNGEKRLFSIKEVGEAAIEQGRSEIGAVRQRLEQSQKSIDKGRQQQKTGQEEFLRARTKLVQSESELEEVYAQLLENKQILESNREELFTKQQQLEKTAEFVKIAYKKLSALEEEVSAEKGYLATELQRVNHLASVLSLGQAEWYQSSQELQQQVNVLLNQGKKVEEFPELLKWRIRLEDEEKRLSQLQQEYNQLQNHYAQSYASYQENYARYQAEQATYQDLNANYQIGLAHYQAALSRYEQEVTVYNTFLNDYEAGLSLLESSSYLLHQESLRLQVSDQELYQAQTSLFTQRETAEQEIQQTETALEEAQSDLNQLESPNYQIHTRNSLPGNDGYTTFSNATKSISAVGTVFPIVLYAVAALVTFTTMTRFVDEERTQIGIFKALGYSNHHMMLKFVLYGLVAGLSGTLVGILFGNYVLSPMISRIITDTMSIGTARIYFYPLWTAIAVGLAIASSGLPAYVVVNRTLKERTAQMLLAKPPMSGSSIWLEKWFFLWSRLRFTHKVTARNIFRYKLRMVMTIFGVAGTVALLFAGLGIRSSISGVVEKQFGEIITYDLLLVENSTASEQEQKELTNFLQSKEVRQSLPVAFEQLTETIAQSGHRKTLSISLFVTNRENFGSLIRLTNVSGQPISMTDRGIVITKKLASIYHITPGDKMELHLEDKTVTATVVGIADMYAGHFVYMTSRYYEELTGTQMRTNADLVELQDDSISHLQKTAKRVLTFPAVRHLIQNSSLMTMLTTVADSLQTIMLILLVLSILLGLVILYNLTIINMSERIRELSTIKVLGFHNKEVTLYIYRETILLSLFGIVVGLIGGSYLHRLLLVLIGSDAIRFNPQVDVEVYLIPVVAIIGILGALGIFVNARLRKLDMLEALKSVD